MRKALDLTGQQYVYLTAVRPTERRSGSSVIWECRCQCGNTTFVSVNSLKNGDTTSCGCLRKEKAAELGRENGRANAKDITDHQYGYLTVVCETERRSSGSIMWECRCQCGNTTFVSVSNLQCGHTTSCGKCYHTQSQLHLRTKETLTNLGYEIYAEEYPVFQQYFSFDDRVSVLRVDLVIWTPRGLVAVECNGKQHYEPIEFFGGEEGFQQTQERDALKKASLKAMNFPLIEVRYDCPDVEAFLKDELNNI